MRNFLFHLFCSTYRIFVLYPQILKQAKSSGSVASGLLTLQETRIQNPQEPKISFGLSLIGMLLYGCDSLDRTE